MAGRSSRRLGRRTRIAVSLAATLAGAAALAALASWTEARRDTDLADARDAVTADHLDAAPAAAPRLAFTEVAAAAGIVVPEPPAPRRRRLPEDTGSGLAWGDADGDGDPDLYVVRFAAPGHLFRNDGGRFTDVTAAAGVGAGGEAMGATFADYDDDGDLDLHVTRRGRDLLYRNRGDGRFDEVGEAAGVAGGDDDWSTGTAWGDFDRDGHLDLYVAGYLRFDAAPAASAGGAGHGAGRWSEVPYTLNPNAFDPQPNRLYRNLGDGTFEEVALPSGVSDPGGRGLAVTACDLDGDGWLDLYVANDVSPNALFRNRGTEGLPGLFEDRSAASGTADPRGSMGLSVTDLELAGDGPDGLPDLFVTHWVAQENALYQAVRGAGGRVEYRDRSRRTRLAEASVERVGWGSAFVDLDLDGLADLAVANGSTLESPAAETGGAPRLTPEAPFLFWNDGERFHDLAPRTAGAAAAHHDGRGLAAADFDGDGDIDLAVARNRAAPLLLRNDTATAHRSLRVRLEGPAAARAGARVEVEAGGRRQVRWAGCDASFLSGHDATLVFGLGAAVSAERVTVAWADGATSELAAVAAGAVTVRHPAAPP